MSHALKIGTMACLAAILISNTASAGFRRVDVGGEILQWFPVDVTGSGTYDLAIRHTADPSEVGVFDPASGTWIDGPHSWPFTGNEWGVADYDGDQHLEYAYRNDSSIYLFDPESGDHTRLWSFSVNQPPVAFFWGKSESGLHYVALTREIHDPDAGTWWNPYRERWSTAIHDVLSGELVTTLESGWQLLPVCVPSETGPSCLLIFKAARTCDATPHTGFRQYLFEVLVVNEHWNVLRTYTLTDEWTGFGSGPCAEKWLRWVASGPSPNGKSAFFLFEVAVALSYGLDPGVFSYSMTNLSPYWEIPITEFYSDYADAVAFDLDERGEDLWLMRFRDGTGWERRILETGEVIDTVTSIPDVKLSTYPLIDAAHRDLFYVQDSSLYIWGLPTDAGNPDTTTSPDTTATPDTTSASMPRDFALRAYPNPFNSNVTLTWSPDAEAKSLDILNILGQRVRSYDLDRETGLNAIEWDGRDQTGVSVPSGAYFARLIAQNRTAITKIVLLK